MSKLINHEKFFKIFSEKYNFHNWDELSPFLKKTYSMVREVKSDTEISIGASKFGGSPDLPRDAVYPFYDEETAFSFIMQINCEELSKCHKNDLLPDKGMIYFFHLFEDEVVTLPYDFEDQGINAYLKGIYVCHCDVSTSGLERVSRPKNKHIEAVKSASIDFVYNYTIPKPWDHEKEYLAAGFTKDEIHYYKGSLSILERALPRLAYEKEDVVLDGELRNFFDKPFHQLLGEPTYYQTPPDAPEDAKSIFGLDIGAIEDWCLLAQIEVDEELNLYWAADGFMYYSIKIDEIKNRNFKSVYAKMQCG